MGISLLRDGPSEGMIRAPAFVMRGRPGARHTGRIVYTNEGFYIRDTPVIMAYLLYLH